MARKQKKVSVRAERLRILKEQADRPNRRLSAAQKLVVDGSGEAAQRAAEALVRSRQKRGKK